MTSLPNFLILGAPRAGTTTLFRRLDAHPEIYMSPNKEPWFFALADETPRFEGPGDPQGIRREEAYRDLFAGRTHEPLAGEASTLYLSSPIAPQRIHAMIPDAKLIAVLRDPVKRAFSNFRHHRQQQREPLHDFQSAVAHIPERRQANWSPFWDYVSMGFYAAALERYRSVFPSIQLKVMLYEDLLQDEMRFMEEIYAFLEVAPPPQQTENVRVNASGQPKSTWLHHFLTHKHPLKKTAKSFFPKETRSKIVTFIQNLNLKEKETISPEMESELRLTYEDDVRQLQEILGRDLEQWLPT